MQNEVLSRILVEINEVVYIFHRFLDLKSHLRQNATRFKFCCMHVSIEEGILALQRGEMLIVVDDETRENEGDIIIPAENVTPETINFLATHCRGLICTPVRPEVATRLGFTPMVEKSDGNTCNFAVTVESKHGIHTGISAFGRAKTVKDIASPLSTADDFIAPGHTFPLLAKKGGVLVRPGHTEASLDLSELAGFTSGVAVLSEICNEDGSMARMPELKKFGEKHGLKVVTIEDLIAYKKQFADITLSSSAPLKTKFGEFTISVFTEHSTGKEHVALVHGDIQKGIPLVRLHSECLTGDVFHSLRCDCGDQLEYGLKTIQESPAGILLYMRQEGRGIGLANKVKAYNLQDQGLDTVEANEKLGFPADARSFHTSAAMLKTLGITTVKLLTNNPKKIDELTQFGINVTERVPCITEVHEDDACYMHTKKTKMGHLL